MGVFVSSHLRRVISLRFAFFLQKFKTKNQTRSDDQLNEIESRECSRGRRDGHLRENLPVGGQKSRWRVVQFLLPRLEMESEAADRFIQ